MPVYKDSGRNSWFVQLNMTDFTGSHKSIKKRGFATKSEADAYEKKLKKRYGSVASLSISEFYPIFMEDLANGLRPSSLRTRKYCFENFILPTLGGYYLREITPDIIHEWQKIFLPQALLLLPCNRLIRPFHPCSDMPCGITVFLLTRSRKPGLI